MNSNIKPLDFYSKTGLMTDPGDQVDMLADLPDNIKDLCAVVQGVMLHVYWAERYGYTIPKERMPEIRIRNVKDMLVAIKKLDDKRLIEKRVVHKKLIGNCRDHSVLLAAMLIQKGIPSRVRCGFARYFTQGQNEDHWVCELWNAKEQRWICVNAQLDQLQRDKLNIAFDPCDVPRDWFMPAGTAWYLCRTGQESPDNFGIFDKRGNWFIRGNMLRDIAALNKAEFLPFDCWGLMNKKDNELSEQDIKLLDHIAELAHAQNDVFSELRSLYLNDERLRVPAVIRTYRLENDSFEKVEVSYKFNSLIQDFVL